jgi:hypothetical protein
VNFFGFLACLSPNEILLSLHIGYYAAGAAIVVTIALCIAGCRQRSFASLPLAALLLAIHPAWTVSVGGDCGFSKRFLSITVSLLLLILMLLQLSKPQFNRCRFVLAVSIACWASSLALLGERLQFFSFYYGEGFFRSVVEGFVFSRFKILSAALISTSGLLLWRSARRFARWPNA